jgi:hypothetical protein
MIFPPIRISQLEKDLKDKELAFERSKNEFTTTLREKARPLTFIKEHPKVIAGLLLSLLTSGKLLLRLGGAVVKTRKNRWLWRILTAGWIWKMVLLALQKAATPVARQVGKSTFDQLFKSFHFKI